MPDSWRVEIVRVPPDAEIHRAAKKELVAPLEELEEEGDLADAKPMQGFRNVWTCRFHAGQWRIVNPVHAEKRFIEVLSIEPRGRVYEGLKSGE